MGPYLPSAEVIAAMRHLNQSQLLAIENEQLQPLLSCLCRFFLLSDRLVASELRQSEAMWLRMHEFQEINRAIASFKKIDFDGIATSIRSCGAEWFATFSPAEGKNVVTEFECRTNDYYQQLGLVMFSLVNLRSHFDSFLRHNACHDDVNVAELLDCPTHWIAVLNAVNIILIELGEVFNVVDVAESLLFLSSTALSPDENGCSLGVILAWWLVAAHPYALSSLLDRIFKWNFSRTSDSTLTKRLSVNRLAFISAYNTIFGNTSQLLHISLGSHTISMLVLSCVSQYLSHVNENCELVSSSVGEICHALDITSNLFTATSLCVGPGTKTQSLSLKLQWIAKHELSVATENELLKKIRAHMLTILKRCNEEWNASGVPPDSAVLSKTIHSIAAFQLRLGLPRLTETEVNSVTDLYRVDYPQTPAHVESICEFICLCCACQELNSAGTFASWLSNWLALWRTSRSANLSSLSEIGELIIQIGLQCYTSPSSSSSHNQASLSALISAKLRLPHVVITSHQMASLSRTFLGSVLPESTLASAVLLIPPSATDTSLPVGKSKISEPSMLAATCVLHLLRSPQFIKHQQHLLLKDWFLTQLKSGFLTLDPSFHLLLENQTNGGWNSQTSSLTQLNPLAVIVESSELSETVADSCKALFNETSDSLHEDDVKFHVNKLLGILFYALTSLDCLVIAGRSGATSTNDSNELFELISLIDKIPVKVLLYFIEKSPPTIYAKVYSGLIRLLYAYFPHICLVSDCLQLHIDAKEIKSIEHPQKPRSELSQTFNQQTANRLVAISNEPFPTRPRHAEYLISMLPELLATMVLADAHDDKMFKPPKLSYSTARLFCSVFVKTAVGFTTRQLSLAARLLIGTTIPPLSSLSLIAGDPSQQFIVEPLTFLTCLDKKAFQCPVVLHVALWLHARLLAANKQFFAHRVMVQSATNANMHPSGPLPPSVLVPLENAENEATVALDLLQQCESVIFLLEICADGRTPVEVRSVICTFVHQLFLRNHQLVKLVHFQTYPLAVVPTAVALIPSIHVCLDFLPELLTTNSTTRQVFSLVLLSHIATLYPVPRAFALAKLAIDVVDTMVTTMTSTKRLEYFGPKSQVFNSLKRLAMCFSPLVEDIVNLLMRVHKMTKCHKASKLVTASPWPKAIMRRNNRDAEFIQAELKATLLDIVRNTKLCRIFVV